MFQFSFAIHITENSLLSKSPRSTKLFRVLIFAYFADWPRSEKISFPRIKYPLNKKLQKLTRFSQIKNSAFNRIGSLGRYTLHFKIKNINMIFHWKTQLPELRYLQESVAQTKQYVKHRKCQVYSNSVHSIGKKRSSEGMPFSKASLVLHFIDWTLGLGWGRWAVYQKHIDPTELWFEIKN